MCNKLYKQHTFWICLMCLCKYKVDSASIVEDTERTQFCPQMDKRTDGQMDGLTGGHGETCIPLQLHGLNVGVGFGLDDLIWGHLQSLGWIKLETFQMWKFIVKQQSACKCLSLQISHQEPVLYSNIYNDSSIRLTKAKGPISLVNFGIIFIQFVCFNCLSYPSDHYQIIIMPNTEVLS